MPGCSRDSPTSWRPLPVDEEYHRLLAAAVSGIGGVERPGQLEMADAVAQSLRDGSHLLVQAGTGTGKSLGYLAPAVAHLLEAGQRVVLATATLALQAQLAAKDVPTIQAAAQQVTGRAPSAAVLKGRSNYACLYRSRSGGGNLDQGALIGAAEVAQTTAEPSRLGAEVLALREWVEKQAEGAESADRDDAPPHTAAGWAQVSIPVRECLGVARCPFGAECFVEASRDRARGADLIITNHAMLAIDAMHGNTVLPEHDAVIIDEAHELTARVTTAATDELTAGLVERTAHRSLTWLEDGLGAEFLETADNLAEALADGPPGRVVDASAAVIYAAAQVRDVARRAITALAGDNDPERTQAAAAVREVFDIAQRIAGLADADVVWISDPPSQPRSVVAAPLSVAGLMSERVFGEATTVCTSATLTVGGSFDTTARALGLMPAARLEEGAEADVDDQSVGAAWRGLDVGSPFDYRRQGIAYAARHLPAPGREGLAPEVLGEIAQLLWAAGGRTLGLFASRRNAEAAAQYCRGELPKQTILCQGDAQLPELQRRFQDDPATSLFGTLSLWQGIDVPGETCQLVIIDKIPFPRPDDPLMQARKQAVDEAGGNGFMSVAAAHAALLLAQGAGRLIRRDTDRGVVAILDPRIVTARYGSFLAASLPGLWPTTDPEVAVQALRRLRGATDEPSLGQRAGAEARG
ncbi:MAG: ATP-dependent DNA helicase [Arachnia sp.]